MAIPGAFLTSRWRKEIGLRYFKAENECLARAFAFVSRKIFSSQRKNEENISLWFYEVRETRLDVIIKSGGIQRLKGQGYSKSYSYRFYRSR